MSSGLYTHEIPSIESPREGSMTDPVYTPNGPHAEGPDPTSDPVHTPSIAAVADPDRGVPNVTVEAPDATAELWSPGPERPWWLARLFRLSDQSTTEVAWIVHRGRPNEYVCAQHGRGMRKDTCEHTRAAVMAAREYQRGITEGALT